MQKCDECGNESEVLYHRSCDMLWVCPPCIMMTIDVGPTRVAEQRNAPVQSERKCPRCAGHGWNHFGGIQLVKCNLCNGTGIYNRSDGG
jgi:hypothetical protein